MENVTSCISETEAPLTGALIAQVIVLGIINLIVIGGNMLVIAAVFTQAKLRTPTNFLIVSLAVADLLVGVLVLPYSISQEVLKAWIFGQIWCHMWLAVDVWMCTSSILNLCAISVDRYIAITRPVHYRSIMSTHRVKLLIALVWVLSFIICFPPLVGWNDVPNTEAVVSTPRSNISDFGSSGNITMDLFDSPEPTCPKPVPCAINDNQGYVIYSAMGSFYIPLTFMLFFYWKIYRAAVKTSKALQRGFKTTKKSAASNGHGEASGENMTLRIHRGTGGAQTRREGDLIVPRRTLSVKPPQKQRRSGGRIGGSFYLAVKFQRRPSPDDQQQPDGAATEEKKPEEKKPAGFSRLSRRNIKWSAKSDAKATKTVGIIVGGFILCWLPFFTVYLIKPFCNGCIPDALFGVFFWLGYCNSAANPLIYGVFSKDFRNAFQKILCRCRLKDDGVSNLIRQIHVPMFLDEDMSNHRPY